MPHFEDLHKLDIPGAYMDSRVASVRIEAFVPPGNAMADIDRVCRTSCNDPAMASMPTVLKPATKLVLKSCLIFSYPQS